MSRRKKSSLDSVYAPLAITAGVIFIIAQNIGVLLFVLALVAVAIISFFSSRQARQRELSEMLDCALDQHRHTLIAEYRRARLKDSFGNIDERKWRKVVERFLRKAVFPELGPASPDRNGSFAQQLRDKVDAYTRYASEQSRFSREQQLVSLDAISPDLYEDLCAGILEEEGWNVHSTTRSRDSGADVVAEKGGVRLIIQCKKYSRPVGNKAVQEVNAALAIYCGTDACVVAPSGYTRQARIEAEALGVALVDHEELAVHAESLFSSRRAASNIPVRVDQ